MSKDNDHIAKACTALIERTETLSKQIIALINLNALLLREVSLSLNPSPWRISRNWKQSLVG